MMTVPAGRKKTEEETGAKRSAGVGWFRSKKFRVEGAPSPLFAVLSPVRREEERGHREEERVVREKEEETLGEKMEREEVGRIGKDSYGKKTKVARPKMTDKGLCGSGPGEKGAER